MKKMMMAVIPGDKKDLILDALIDAGHTATFLESRGGVLRQSQLLLFIAAEADEVTGILSIIRENCHTEVKVDATQSAGEFLPTHRSTTTQVGGALVFIWDLERMENY
jgi:uncharacterized protein YaaQ